VWSNGTWNLKSGLLRLSRWSPDFHSSSQKQTHSQVWLCFHYLPLEYRQPITLFEIVGAIGTPITIDENTRNHAFGQYARVLVDVDLDGFLSDTLLVEREKFSFDIEIEYERPLYFCFIAILLAILLIIVKGILSIKLLLKRLPPKLILQKNSNIILFLKWMSIKCKVVANQ